MSNLKQPENKDEKNDSFNVPLKKSPLFIFGLLQIPLVIIMVLMLYFLYQSQKA